MKNLLLLMSIFVMSTMAWSQSNSKTVSGTVYDEYKRALPNATITIFGSKRQVRSDDQGKYTVYVKSSDKLMFNHPEHLLNIEAIDDRNTINVYLKSNDNKRDEELEGALSIKTNADAVTYTSQTVKPDLLLIGRNPDAVKALEGKVSGLRVTNQNGVNETSRIILRGTRSLLGDDAALVVIDGIPSDYRALESISDNLIESITVLKGANGAALYGSQGGNGAILVKTKRNVDNAGGINQLSQNTQYIDNDFRYTKRLKVNYKESIPSYIKDIESKSMSDAFAEYQVDKDNYWGHSAYFIDMFEYFNDNNEGGYSQQIFDDIINSDKVDYATLRAFAFYLESEGNFIHTNIAYNKVLNFKSDDAKSYRSIALINQELDKNQIALNTLNVVVDSEYMYNQGIYNAMGIKNITLHELNNLVQMDTSLKVEELDRINEIKTTYDLRVVVEANRDDVNLNIKVVEPYLEVSSVDNQTTRIGGEMNTLDGLNEYSIRNARKGSYYLIADYSQNPDEVVSFIKVTIFKDYGKSNVTKEVMVMRLTNDKKEQIVQKIDF